VSLIVTSDIVLFCYWRWASKQLYSQ